jgi:hypothetical protein
VPSRHQGAGGGVAPGTLFKPLTPVIQRVFSILAAMLKDALNNSFPGVLRLGYFSDGANLS